MGDTNLFGQEWMILPDEPSLFTEWNDRPAECTLPEPAATHDRRLGEQGSVRIEQAEAACVDKPDHDFCVYDVLATGDVDMAGTY